MFLKIAAVTVLIAGLLAVLADGRLLARAGLVGHCTAAAAPQGADGSWQVCRPGRLEGRPNLVGKSCVSQGVNGNAEYWRCPAPIVASSTPRD
jgi:hypothetical protein